MTDNVQPPIPDPNGPPILPYASPSLGKRALKITLGTVAGGAATAVTLFVVAGALVMPTSGAQRSTRIRWEKRRQEIAAAQGAADSSDADAKASPALPQQDAPK